MYTKRFLTLFIALSSSTLFGVTSYYSIRSQATNAARELAGSGWATQINLCDVGHDYGNFAITAEYTKSFKPHYIGKSLFGCCSGCPYPCGTCCGTSSCGPCGTSCCDPCCSSCDDKSTFIKISGSQVEDRGACDWLADYFGLPTDYKSCVTFEPRISNFLIDFNLYAGLDRCPGLYFRFHFPVVYTKWDLNMCECVENCGTNNHWAGYFSDTLNVVGTSTYGILRNNLVSSFTSFITGCDTITDSTITLNQLCFARMCACKQTKTRLAELTGVVGWNFWYGEDYHFGANIRAAAPAGNRPNAFYLFEPIVGNGKHWELGGGITGHWTFWRSEDEEKYCSLYIDANLTHLFRTKQYRTFDLNCKPLSRYMLAAKFDRPVINLLAGATPGDGPPIKQFKGVYAPVANLTTFPVDVCADIQADVAVKFEHVRGNWGCDLGYNLWTRSCEEIDFHCGCECPFEENTWALKGDAFMYGFTVANGIPQSPGIALSASQSQATLCHGTNNYPLGITEFIAGNYVTTDWFRNPGVDNRNLAWTATAAELYTFPPDGAPQQVYTSKEPIFLSFCDIDCESAQSRGLSHKIFGSIDHTWRDRERAIPYFGIGFEVEFAYHTFDEGCDQCCYPHLTEYSCGNCYYPCDRCCEDACCCQWCALSQWGIWAKGGIAF